VVTNESAALDKWGLRLKYSTWGKQFHCAQSAKRNILDAPNHKGILNNSTVFNRIAEMLNTNLPYPAVINK